MTKEIFKKFIGISTLVVALTVMGIAQERSTFTGTAIIYGNGTNTRVVTRSFKLYLNGVTSDSQADQYLEILKKDGQDGLLDAIKSHDIGRFSLAERVGPVVNAARVDDVGGMKRIRVIFARWLGFGELRYGYRSVDYPFSYIELLIDPATGEGQGTYFPAARIRFDKNGSGPDIVEIEDFGTFPAKLLGVKMSGGLP